MNPEAHAAWLKCREQLMKQQWQLCAIELAMRGFMAGWDARGVIAEEALEVAHDALRTAIEELT